MSKPFLIKQGDTLPTFTGKLQQHNGDPIDLDGATVYLNIYGPEGAIITDAVMTVLDLTTAEVEYTWTDGDTDTPGPYSAECRVVFANGKKRTIPTEGTVTIRVNPTLG